MVTNAHIQKLLVKESRHFKQLNMPKEADIFKKYADQLEHSIAEATNQAPRSAQKKRWDALPEMYPALGFASVFLALGLVVFLALSIRDNLKPTLSTLPAVVTTVETSSGYRKINIPTDRNMSGLDLSRADLSDADLFRAVLSHASLFGADLSGAYLTGAYLSGVDLTGADLSFADLTGADLSDADLSDADLSFAVLSDADLSGADLTGAFLFRADLSDANLFGADLSDANLFGADLTGADLRRARYSSGTQWPDGFDYQNSGAIGPNADLRNADLSFADLFRADLTGADLTGADLSGADLSDADLFRADLSDANLFGADLSGARYNSSTQWPDGFNYNAAGAISAEE